MSDEEGEEEGKGPKSLKKGGVPAKCYGGAPKREGSLIKGAFMCKTPGTARPTAIFQCMNTPRKDLTRHPQAAPPCGDPLGLVDSRGPDHFPPQGGMLTKTCGVKAQFVGEIVIKKDIPPRIQGCGGEDCPITKPKIAPSPPEGCGSAAPNPPCARPMSPAHHHQAPICCTPCTPCQPEISEDCRRALRRCGPDSSRCHPEGMFGELDEKLCGGADYCAERALHPGEEERYESSRTREEVTMDPCDPRRNMCGGCDCGLDAKYVRVEDTFRRQRMYSPPVEAMPPPISYPCIPSTSDPCSPCNTPPCVPGMPPCSPPCPPPCPIPCSPPCPSPCIPSALPREPYGVYPPPTTETNWNAPPYYADKPCDPRWADVHYNPSNEYEPTRCRPDCWNNPYQPYAEYKPPYTPNSPEYMSRPECELQCRIPTVM